MPSGVKNTGYHFCLESDNFDADYDRLKKAGIPVQTEPHPAAVRERENFPFCHSSLLLYSI